MTIDSAAGNIYIQGTINAGSINITAKNGNFVTSYVNGFDPIGGDPASQSPTLDPATGQANQTGLGQGITANGQIYIAARYLNINSTVQSGIVNWTLNIASSICLLRRIRAISASIKTPSTPTFRPTSSRSRKG